MGWLWQRLVLETVVLLSVTRICAAAATISTTTQKAAKSHYCKTPSDSFIFENGFYSQSWSPRALYFYCDYGYTLSGPAVQRCSKNGTWVPPEPPVCLKAACPEPDTFPNGKYTSSGYPETVQYSCHSGYTLSGPEKQQCTNGKWDPPQQPVCKGSSTKSCAIPTLKNGWTETRHNAVPGDLSLPKNYIVLQCDDNFAVTVNGVKKQRVILYCLDGVEWMTKEGWVPPAFRCEANTCGSPPEINNAHRVMETDNTGSHVEYGCVRGYVLQDPTQSGLDCQNGVWTGIWPICVLEGGCSEPGSIDNGEYTVYTDMDPTLSGSIYNTQYRIGSSVHYECNNGFELFGYDKQTCLSGGRWSGKPPRCLYNQDSPTPCPALSNIENGHCDCDTKADLSLCQPFYQGLHVECVCNRGFKLIGQAILTCGHTGSWDYKMPTCIKESAIDTAPREPGESSGESSNPSHMSTLAIVVATACSVLGVLLLIMVIMIFRRRKPRPPSRLCRPSATPPPYSRVHNNSLDELDRYLLVGYENPTRANLPTYEEAMATGQSQTGHRHDHTPRSDEGHGQVGEYRPLPSIPGSFRANQMMCGENTSRHSIITTSTMNRDGVSELFGSIDTVNVSVSDASTAVTIETLDSATSHHSNMSRRATAGSITSEHSNESLVTEDAPLLDSIQREDNDKSDDDSSRSGHDD